MSLSEQAPPDITQIANSGNHLNKNHNSRIDQRLRKDQMQGGDDIEFLSRIKPLFNLINFLDRELSTIMTRTQLFIDFN